MKLNLFLFSTNQLWLGFPQHTNNYIIKVRTAIFKAVKDVWDSTDLKFKKFNELAIELMWLLNIQRNNFVLRFIGMVFKA